MKLQLEIELRIKFLTFLSFIFGIIKSLVRLEYNRMLLFDIEKFCVFSEAKTNSEIMNPYFNQLSN